LVREFQIPINQNPRTLLDLFQNPNKPLTIFAEIELSDEEYSHLRLNAAELLQKHIITLAPLNQRGPQAGVLLDARSASYRHEVEKEAHKILPHFLRELKARLFIADVRITPTLKDSVRCSRVLNVIFGTYDPKHIGMVDFHGPHRNYVREQIGGIDLSIQSTGERVRDSALYNYANKYSNLKAELAAGYIRQLLAKAAGASARDYEDLTKTLAELFAAFFPGKQFMGPESTADGKLSFRVQTRSGTFHDINELSSGEKEVLYGYLRIRNVAPRHSVILIDEPELHLNPRLVHGLPDFYHKNLGKTLDNQVWLLTHSDALLRNSVERGEFSVFHMQQAEVNKQTENQATQVLIQKDLDRAVVDLVGDLAAYRPGAKLVIFEGGGDSQFDRKMCSALFPEFASAVNMISAQDKSRVRQLHALLRDAHEAGTLPFKVYSITDRDSDQATIAIPRELRWDVYHIENYLLESKYILRTLNDLHLRSGAFSSESDVENGLREAAEETMSDLIRHELEQSANQSLVKTVKTATDRSSASIAQALYNSVVASSKQFNETLRRDLNLSSLKKKERIIKQKLISDLNSGAWRKNFRGRDILSRLKNKCKVCGSYVEFRNLIIARMRDDGFQPGGMKSVIVGILSDSN